MTKLLSLLALALLVTAPAAAAPAPAAPTTPALGPEEAFFSLDPDGGRTLRLLLEDHVGGDYAYTRVDLSNAHETAGNLVALANPGVGQTIRDTREPIREAGAFAHAWTRGASPMTTVGIYVIHDTEGLLRAPLVILENVSSTSDLVATVTNVALNEAGDMTFHAVPILLEYAAPELTGNMEMWPPSWSSVDTFRDYPRVYAWTMRKATPAGEVWEGAYLERLGSWSGGFHPETSFQGTKIIETGNALRVDGATTRVAGAYLETTLTKAAGDPQKVEHRVTAGAANEEAGRVPLAGVSFQDERAGDNRFVHSASQSSGVVIGAYVAGAWTPLVGTWTEAQHVASGADVEQTRLTSVGAYVEGEYVPLAGVRYHGDRSTTLDWALRFVAGGTLGADTMGDWEIDAGTFLDGEFVPLAGATYADDFADAWFRHQAMVTMGVHTPLGYQPLVGATYDGEVPLLTWSLAWAGGNRAATLDWMTSVGTFALDAYVPLVGARFDNAAPGATRTYQEHYQVGTFLGHYRAFVPILAASWDGDEQHVAWTARAALGGGLGANVGDWDASAGVYALDAYVPMLEAQYRRSYNDDYGAQTFLTIGTRASGEFTPLVGVTYSSTVPLVASLGSPLSLRDDTRAFITAGVFVQGEYVPLVVVENGPDAVYVGVAPPYY